MNKPIVIIGGASLDTIIQLDALPTPTPQTLWPKSSYRSVGSTGAGKALNLAALGRSVVLHSLLGQDTRWTRIAGGFRCLSNLRLTQVSLIGHR